MHILIIGLGNQGKKRIRNLNKTDKYITLDPHNPDADFKSIKDIPLEKFDIAFLCVPDNLKISYIKFLIKNGKHHLVEKPLLIDSNNLNELKRLSKKYRTVSYTAYNHRFEPHFQNLKKIIDEKKIGKFYVCNLFYGNGTSALVKKSKWKDYRSGVLADLGSHIFDICFFWFGKNIKRVKKITNNSFENKSYDFCSFIIEYKFGFLVQVNLTYCMWKNDFTCDVLAKNGSAHISSLVKWRPSIFSLRLRKYPSGEPREFIKTISGLDPTWKKEYIHFKKLIKQKKFNDFDKDYKINKYINFLAK